MAKKSIRSLFIGLEEAYKTINWLIHNRKKTEHYILAVSHVLDGGGAPVVLWETVQVLIDLGYKVAVASPGYGNLVHIMRQNGVKVLVCKRFKALLRKLILRQMWKAVFINTLEMHEWVRESSDKTPVIWWLHEGNAYARCYKGSKKLFTKNNVTVVCVSEWSKKCLSKVGVPSDAPVLYYGLKEKKIAEYSQHNKFTFTMIGSICERKRVMDFLDAILLLPSEVRTKCRFLIIGRGIPSEPNYLKQFRKKLAQVEGVDYKEFVPNDKIPEIYEKTDVLVCASDDDPLPVVVTDAFMYKKSVLISNCIGQCALVEDGMNGYIFHAGNVKELNEKMLQASYSRALNNEIGKNGHKLFDNNFKAERHKEQLCILLENLGL